MRIAVPMKGQVLDQHFGHCEQFALIDVAPETRQVSASQVVPAPVHAHGALPKWLAEQQVGVVIAGGMGDHARILLEGAGIDVITGAPSDEPIALVARYLDGTLLSVEQRCNHTCSH